MSEPVIDVVDVKKSYDGVQAVRGLTFSVAAGEVFGILGPNGAGKTTMIRMIVDIIRPDAGTVRVFGGPLTPDTLGRIGYLPEERGLYQRLKIRETLRFLARLKGLELHVADSRIEKYLDRVGMLDCVDRRMRELSKGMQQKIQLVATVLHEPDLLILDEPFSGLDPVNREVIVSVIKECAARGAAVMLSTHLMDQVQALATRVLLINRGEAALMGEVGKIREDFADGSVLIRAKCDLATQPEVASVAADGDAARVMLKPGVTPEDFLRNLAGRGVVLHRFERRLPTLDEVYLRVVKPSSAKASEGKR